VDIGASRSTIPLQRGRSRDSKTNYTRIADTRWIRSAKILANVHGVRIDPAAPRQIVVVCDRAFDNVPDYLLWPSPMAHAVGYSTGESGLISPEEFKRLDLSGFVDLRTEIPRISD
jgi:hypothetical protein